MENVESTGEPAAREPCLGPLEALHMIPAPYLKPDHWEWFLGFWRCLPKKEAQTPLWEISNTYPNKPSVRNSRRPWNKKMAFLFNYHLLFLNKDRLKWMTEKGKKFTFPMLY